MVVFGDLGVWEDLGSSALSQTLIFSSRGEEMASRSDGKGGTWSDLSLDLPGMSL